MAGLAFLFPLLSLSPQTAPPPPADTEPAIGLTPPEVPAAGDQESILAIDRFGRYAVEVGNDQGSSLELVDRMAGTLGRSGTVGRESGRLDLFLDRGRYKLRIASSARGRGKAKLAAHAFHEKRPAGTPPPLLVETRLIEETLGDYQQLSWWLDVREGRQETDRREVRLEAAGRNLNDLRLWKDGTWLTADEPDCQTIQPVVGQPMLRCRLVAVLAAGLYQVSAYGGRPQPWADGTDAHPLYLRWGAPKLPAAGRRRYVVSPFGADLFRLPEQSNFVRLELPEARPAALAVRWERRGRPLGERPGNTAVIAKESRLPAAEVSAPEKPKPDEPVPQATPHPAPQPVVQEDDAADQATGEIPADTTPTSEAPADVNAEPAPADESAETGEGMPAAEEAPAEPAQAPDTASDTAPDTGTKPATLPWELWVEVDGAPGQPYVLQHFERRDVYTFREEGPHWVSSIHAGAAADSIDATVLVTETPPDKPERFLTAAAIPLDGHTAWQRRFNLLAPATLFLEVKETGRYRVATSGTAARARVEPFLLSRPKSYQSPDFQGASSAWALDPGFYVLTLEPVRKGIVELTLRPAGKEGQALPVQPQPVRASARFAPLDLQPDRLYTAYANRQPGVTAGWVVRPWPVDLAAPLPVAQRPGELFEIPVRAVQGGALRAEAEDGSRLPVAVDGGPWVAEAPVLPGEHKVAVRNDRQQTVNYSLGIEPDALRATTPLPPLPPAALAGVPQLPALAAGAPRYLDLGTAQNATYLVRAGKPGLYAVRSTGLLATAGTLRTRTVPRVRREEMNGVGRNFLLQQYLSEGDYQVTVETLGATRGHLGLALDSTPLVDGGVLRPGVPGHFSLPAGQAAVVRLEIPPEEGPAPGTYTLSALGLGFRFTGRFEDADGWPLARPGDVVDLKRPLAAGTYRLVLLPQPVDARALVLLDRQPEPRKFTGHGPHPLPLAARPEDRAEGLWLEPEGDSPRLPDLWTFELPAPARTTVELSDEMEGKITRLDDRSGAETPELAAVPPGRSWTGELAAGRYQLAAVCSRPDSRVRYTVKVSTEELTVGQSRAVRAPLDVPVSVGREQLAELASTGNADVRAHLYDAAGKLVAESDDRPDGWDFLLSQRLAPGRYDLRIDPVGAGRATVRVGMRNPAEIAGAALPLPYHGDVQVGGDVLVRPLQVGARADLLLVAARSKDNLGLSVEVRDVQGGTSWRTLGTAVAREAHLEIPLAGPERDYRLRLWSIDRQGTPAHLAAAAIAAPRLAERELRRGVGLPAVTGFSPVRAAAVVTLDRPGVFRFADPGAGLRGGAAGAPLAPLGTDAGSVLAAPGDRFWLVRDGRGGTVRAERVAVAAGLAIGDVGDMGAQLPVADGVAVSCDLAVPKDAAAGPVLALVTSPLGQPGVRVDDRAERAPAGAPAATALAVGPRSALAVALAPREPVARVWQAGGGDGQTLEMRLAQLRFPPLAWGGAPAARWGVLDGRLEGIRAEALGLPAGPRNLRLSLGEATVAVLSRGDTVVSVHWQGGAPFEELLEDDAATRLTLLHTRAGADPWRVEILPRGQGEEALALTAGAPFERALDRAGTLRVALPAGPAAATLHVRGANTAGTEAVLLGRDGRVARGADLPVGAGGTLLLRHGPGLLLAWLGTTGTAGDDTAALWASGSGAPGERPAPVAVTPPATVPLAGRFVELAVADPGSRTGARVLHLRTSVPVATVVRRGGNGSDDVAVHPESGRLDVYLPAGEARIGLRALAGGELSGFAEVTATPVTEVGEGLGPAVLLPAGGARWFSFHVERKGPVGVGVHADSDVVEIALYDRGGRRLDDSGGGRGGVVRMPELVPGDYLLALTTPAGAAPVKARPALAGLTLPDTGPPEEVIRQYLQQAGAEPAPETETGSQP